MSALAIPDIRSVFQRKADAEKREEIAKARRALAQSYALTFSTPTGQAVLADLEREGKLTEPLFGLGDSGPVDPFRLGALEGRRQLLLYILAQIDEGRTGEPQ